MSTAVITRSRVIAAVVCAAIVLGGVLAFFLVRGDNKKAAPADRSDPAARLAGFPNASSTGPSGGDLVAVPGAATAGAGWRWNGYNLVALAADVELRDLDVQGGIDTSQFGGITIDNVRVRCVGVTDWCLSIGPRSTVTAAEIGGGADGKTFLPATGIFSNGPNNVLQRVDIHHTVDGARIDGGTTVVDSFVHDLAMGEIPGVHSDGSQSTESGGPVVFRHNHLIGGNNDAIFIQAGAAFTITDNLIETRRRDDQVSSYGVGGGGSRVTGPIVVTGNLFGRGWQILPIQLDAWPASTTIADNSYVDGGLVPQTR